MSTDVVCRVNKLAILEFDRNRKSMSTIVNSGATEGNVLLVKGAAECVLSRCTKVSCSKLISASVQLSDASAGCGYLQKQWCYGIMSSGQGLCVSCGRYAAR